MVRRAHAGDLGGSEDRTSFLKNTCPHM
jgi:hypothetical protein